MIEEQHQLPQNIPSVSKNKKQLIKPVNNKSKLSLITLIFDDKSDSFENLFSFINFVDESTPDIYSLIRKKSKSTQSQVEKAQNFNTSLLSSEDILNFLSIAMPKILFNMLIQTQLLPANTIKNPTPNIECLYKISSLEYFLKTKTNYYTLMRSLIKILLDMELKPSQQKKLMEIVFNYFYVYHQDKKSLATDYFIETYNKLDQSTRFALSDQFLLFFRIIKKIGKGKFINFLLEKSPWLKDINTKINDNHLIGYQRSMLSPYSAYVGIGESILVNNGQKITRSFEILQDYSIFFYKIIMKNQDITFRLYYLGEHGDNNTKTLLFQHEKYPEQKSSNAVAVKRGIYQFQFDNTYSWINKKTLRYEIVIMNPLQLKAAEPSTRISQFYPDFEGNEVNEDIIIHLPKPTKKKDAIKFQGTCNITKNGPFFNLKLKKGNTVYEFQSENEQKMIRKFNQLIQSEKKVKFLVDSEPLETDQAVLDRIKNYSSKKTSKNSESALNSKRTQKINQNFDQTDKLDTTTAKLTQVGIQS